MAGTGKFYKHYKYFKEFDVTLARIMATVHRVNAFAKKNNNFRILKIVYKLLHIFSGLDFGFFKTSNIVFWSSVSLTQVLFFCYACFLLIQNQNVFLGISIGLVLIRYILIALCMILIKPSRKFANLFTDLETIDFELQVKSETTNVEIKILIVMLLHFIIRIPATVVMLMISPDYKLEPFACCLLLLWLVTCLFLVDISYAFVFYSVKYRLKKLDVLLRETNSGFGALQKTYKSIVDLTESYKTAFDPLFIVSLLNSVLEVITTLYYAVIQLRVGGSFGFQYMRMEYILVLESLFVLFAPPIYAGQLSIQANQIQLTLHEKLMENLDARKIGEIKRFIRYVEARGCRFRVYKVIPLDADLLGMVLSFCATYLIVIIQFTNS